MSLFNFMRTGTSFDSWLTTDTEAENAQIQQEWVEQEVWDLLRVNNSLVSINALWESINEEALATKKEEIEQAMEDKNYARLGQLIYHLNLDYWETLYTKEAENNWENENGI